MDKSLSLKVLHVGGQGDINTLQPLRSANLSVETTVLEALAGAVTTGHNRQLCACVFGHEGAATFHVTRNPQASSLYPMNTRFADWHHNGRAWRDEATLDHEVELKTVTLDTLLTTGAIEQPHFLSMDAQGSEYEVMLGATRLMADHVVAAITEVETAPIYQGQPLLSDQMAIMGGKGFLPVKILTQQMWLPPGIEDMGAAMLVVMEILWLRDSRWFRVGSHREEDLFRLSACAQAFDAEVVRA